MNIPDCVQEMVTALSGRESSIVNSRLRNQIESYTRQLKLLQQSLDASTKALACLHEFELMTESDTSGKPKFIDWRCKHCKNSVGTWPV